VKRYAKTFLNTFCLIFTFRALLRKSYVSRFIELLKYHREVSKHTNPLQVDNLITKKIVAILEEF
jgi:hypothetical protein